MYCDANGRPDPNGDYQMIDGKMLLRDGRCIRFSVNMMDGKPAASSANQVFLRDTSPVPTMFNDAENRLFMSDEGRVLVARARATHERKHAYMGDSAPAFTDAQAAQVIRQATAQKARAQSFADNIEAASDQAKAVFDAAQAAAAARRQRYTR